jgi:hypothetical protein
VWFIRRAECDEEKGKINNSLTGESIWHGNFMLEIRSREIYQT